MQVLFPVANSCIPNSANQSRPTYLPTYLLERAPHYQALPLLALLRTCRVLNAMSLVPTNVFTAVSAGPTLRTVHLTILVWTFPVSLAIPYYVLLCSWQFPAVPTLSWGYTVPVITTELPKLPLKREIWPLRSDHCGTPGRMKVVSRY